VEIVFGRTVCETISVTPYPSLPECARLTSRILHIGMRMADYDNQRVLIVIIYICNGTAFDGTFSIGEAQFTFRRF